MTIRPLIIWLVALAFVMFGLYKISGYDMSLEAFLGNFGLPAWLIHLIGAAEIAGAIGLAFGRRFHRHLPHLAALCLTLLMLGAIGLHLLADPLIKALPATVLLLLLAYLLFRPKSETSAV